MQGAPANYLGKIVSKKNFRVFIYSVDGQEKLAESWDEFEKNMATGLWFPTVEDANEAALSQDAKEKEDEGGFKSKRNKKSLENGFTKERK